MARRSPEVVAQEDRDSRSKELWGECQKKYSDRGDASRCYQRNIRLTDIERYTVPVEGNVL